MRRSCWLALLGVASGCGGPGFSAAPTQDASTDAMERSDALGDVATDHPDAAIAGQDAGTSDVGSGTDDATGGDSSSASDAGAESTSGDEASAEAAAPEGGKERDAQGNGPEGGEPEAGLDAGAGDSSPDAPDAQGGFDAEACAPVLYFLDQDGDGYGGTSTSTSCAPPATGTWVTRGGDCDDSNPTVNPGQSAYFAVSYMPPGATAVSFDYNCDGSETESGSAAKADCEVTSLSCVGSGYLEASPVRSGPGVDAYCGSEDAVTCAVTDLVCKAGSPYTVAPITCH